jgi:hypothetical protein
LTEQLTDPADLGTILIRSVCNVASADEFAQHAVHITCQDPNAGLAPLAIAQGETNGGPGQGELRIQARDSEAGFIALRDFSRAVHSVHQLRNVRFHVTAPMKSGRPTPLRTAPLWLPLAVGVGAIMLPRRRRRDQSVNLPSTTG